MSNPFLRDEDFYKQNLNPIGNYIEQSSFYLSKIKGIDQEIIKEKLRDKIKNKELGFTNPLVKYLDRKDYADRELTLKPLSVFIASAVKENLIIAPSMTCYTPASERESILSEFSDENVLLRNKAKKEAAVYEAKKDMLNFLFKNEEQANAKLDNNSVSGGFSSGGCVFRNPSAHSSLTSTVRMMTSIGNSSNERIIGGKRHYRNPEITLNNIISLTHRCCKEEIKEAIRLFNLKIPTVDDVLNCVQRSTRFYWHDVKKLNKIRDFICKLDDIERAAVTYTGDLYTLRTLNPDFVRNMLFDFSRKITDKVYDNPIDVIKKTDEMYVNYAHQICITEVKGKGKDYGSLSKEAVNTLAAVCENLYLSVEKYKVLIRSFLLTNDLPPSAAYFRDSIRLNVPLSDTDSTMFSCDEWVIWYFNELIFTDEAFAVSGAIMFIATQCIAHSLAIYSANINVERKKLFMAAMKPEYVFPIFSLTSAGKHYYSYIFIKEGSVFDEYKIEVKGVHLKSSAAPEPVNKALKQTMKDILNTPLMGQKISLTKHINGCLKLENDVRESVLKGELVYLTRLYIKPSESYKVSPVLSNYRHHLFWNEIFSDKYGKAPDPTYAAAKLPTIVTSKTKLKHWLSNIEDKTIASKLANYFERTKRTNINTIYIALDLLETVGIPIEIKQIINIKELVLEHTSSYKMLLESLGYFVKQDETIGYL